MIGKYQSAKMRVGQKTYRWLAFMGGIGRTEIENLKKHRFEIGVICFGIGIGIYFALPFEPDLGLTFGVCIAGLIAYACLVRLRVFGSAIRFGVLTVVLIGLGVGRSAWHSQGLASVFLPEGRQHYTVIGWIEAVERTGANLRWRIRVTDMPQSGLKNLPQRVRIRAPVNNVSVGHGVRLEAVLRPPPEPVLPQGYDPGLRAYFDRVGGYGFAVGQPEFTQVESRTAGEYIYRWIARMRYRFADYIQAQAKHRTAGLQAALLTGIKSAIPRKQTENLRVAGLAHILAISGLHMGLIAGGCYFLSSLLLALVAPLARRYDVRKFAACLAIFGASLYLIISGASIATQRAYIMALILFMAVLLNRRALSIRSVAIAALICLWIYPVSFISAGFHMSFAATLALISFYEFWRGLGLMPYRPGIWAYINRILASTALTSLIAGAATAGYAGLHFNRIAAYGFVANLAAMPIFSFFVMPMALLSILLWPLNLSGVALWGMGAGIDVILYIAEYIAQRDEALLTIPQPPYWVLAVYSAGFISLCIGARLLKSIGVSLMTICLVFWGTAPAVDMRISEKGYISFWDETVDLLYVDSKRADRYGRAQFMRRAGREGVTVEAYQATQAQCDSRACRMHLKGADVAIVQAPDVLAQECHSSDLVVLIRRKAGPVIRRSCEAVLIDETDRMRNGAYDILIEADSGQIYYRFSNSLKRQKRFWSRGYMARDNGGSAQP